MEILAMIRQAFRDESMSCMRKVQTRKTVRGDKNKVKSMLIIFFDTRMIVHKEFFLAGQTAVMFYGDCVEMCEDFASNFGDSRTVAL
jgi:hypothetical protein